MGAADNGASGAATSPGRSTTTWRSWPRGEPHEVYRYDAGHGSLVDDERVRQVKAEIDFVTRHLSAVK
jgi:hypothetical protein